MTDVVVATSESDLRAAEAVEQHHAEMAGQLTALVGELLAAASLPDPKRAEAARARLVRWCENDLLPHARAEEQALYPAAHATVDGRLLLQAMTGEHETIGGLVRKLAELEGKPVEATATAAALHAVFESHLAKENDIVLPLLLRTPGVSVADLLGGMHEVLGESTHEAHDTSSGACGSGHTCTCGEKDAEGYPELDARSIPHAIRHATIFGALETVRPGAGLVLVAPHDPLPLLAQIEDRWHGAFTVDYLERGPEAWRLALVRSAS